MFGHQGARHIIIKVLILTCGLYRAGGNTHTQNGGQAVMARLWCVVRTTDEAKLSALSYLVLCEYRSCYFRGVVAGEVEIPCGPQSDGTCAALHDGH